MEIIAPPTKFEDLIQSYVARQAQLVACFMSMLGKRDWRFFTDVPRRGEMECADVKWKFFVHGTGVRFVGLAVIDVDRHIDADPRAFSAGRLVDYAESLGISDVLVGDTIVAIGYETCSSLLRKLNMDGYLDRLPHLLGTMYIVHQSRQSVP